MKNIKNILFIIMALTMFIGCDTVKHANSTGIVVVGMRQSAKYGSCPGSDVDAVVMTDILSKYGNVKVLMNNQATKTAVTQALTDASKKDLMIFYYSGHGGSDPIGDVSGEDDGRNEYLCLYNTYMLDNEIWNIVQNAKGRVFLIFDCCHSKTMFRTPVFSMQNTNTLFSASPRGVNMLCWSGCPDNTYSYGDNSGGEFTKAIKRHYSKKFTYDEMWSRILKDKPLKESQLVQKTQIGHGFGGKVFK